MKKIYPITVFITLFAIYLLTNYPDLTYTDSGELASVLTTLGVAHPTGYPVFTMIGHLWTYLPISESPIYELNVLSGFFTALAGVTLYYTLLLLSKNKDRIIALSVAIAFGAGNLVWGQALSIEVYSLHLLFVNLILYFLVKFYFQKNFKDLALLTLIIGLSFGNHLTTILFIPAYLLIFFKANTKREFKSIKFWLSIAGLLLLGLSSYLYLPLNSMSEPLFNWGAVHRSWEKFLYHVSGKQYQIWMFSDSDIMKQNLASFFKMIPQEMNMLLVFLPIGILKLINKSPYLAFTFLLSTVTVAVYASGYVIHDIDVYFAPALLLIEIFGFYALISFLEKREKLKPLALIIPIISIAGNWKDKNHSDDRIVPEYVKLVTESLPKNSIILSAQWDFWCSAFWYKQQVENYRSDIIIIEKELLRRTWYPKQLLKWYPVLEKSRPEIESYLEILERFENGQPFDRKEIQLKFILMLRSLTEKYEDERSIFVSSDILQTEKGFAPNHYKYPYGMLFQILRPSEAFENPNPENYLVEEFASMKRLTSPSHLDNGIYEQAAQGMAANAYYQMSENNIKLAIKFAEKSLKINPENEIALKVKNAVRASNQK